MKLLKYLSLVALLLVTGFTYAQDEAPEERKPGHTNVTADLNNCTKSSQLQMRTEVRTELQARSTISSRRIM